VIGPVAGKITLVGIAGRVLLWSCEFLVRLLVDTYSRLMDVFLEQKGPLSSKSDSAIIEGCVDYEASVSHIMVFETVAVAPAQPMAFVVTSATATLSSSRLDCSP
jgi:hypothetical protein